VGEGRLGLENLGSRVGRHTLDLIVWMTGMSRQAGRGESQGGAAPPPVYPFRTAAEKFSGDRRSSAAR